MDRRRARLGAQVGVGATLSLARGIKQSIVGEVRATFNDRTKGETPVTRRPDGLFGPRSVAWRVHGDVTSMMVGGMAALLLQMLYPAVLAGVWDHSNFRADMIGRLRRTARFIALTTYGGRDEAEAAIERVRAIHHQVRGTLGDGTPYSADEPRLLAWVHVTEVLSFLDSWRRYGEPAMSLAEQDRYVDEVARVGEALGADPLPRSRAEAERLMQAMRGDLRADARSREVARLVLNTAVTTPAARLFRSLTSQAAVDLLPDWARDMHGLSDPLLLRPLVRAGTYGVASTIRWAFR